MTSSNLQNELKKFQQWMAEVDAIVGEYREMSVYELAPDAPFSVWFEEGKPAIEAAAWAIEIGG